MISFWQFLLRRHRQSVGHDQGMHLRDLSSCQPASQATSISSHFQPALLPALRPRSASSQRAVLKPSAHSTVCCVLGGGSSARRRRCRTMGAPGQLCSRNRLHGGRAANWSLLSLPSPGALRGRHAPGHSRTQSSKTPNSHPFLSAPSSHLYLNSTLYSLCLV